MKNKYEARLGTERMLPLVFKMALPAVAAQFVNLLYNIVDRIYIGHIPEIGTNALGGIGVTTSIVIWMLVSCSRFFSSAAISVIISARKVSYWSYTLTPIFREVTVSAFWLPPHPVSSPAASSAAAAPAICLLCFLIASSLLHDREQQPL